MKICSDSNGNVVSDVEDESVSSECLVDEVYGISDDDLFQGSSVSTQTVTSVSTVGTQTPWTVYVELSLNPNCTTEKDSNEMSCHPNISPICNHTDSLNSFSFENDPTYVCDEDLCAFLNKIGQ
jgi:hypothetical protein